MAKVLALDIGKKRTGIAETDPFQLIATGMPTVFTADLFTFLQGYISEEKPELLVVGEPKQMGGMPSEVEPFIQEVLAKIKAKWPTLLVKRVDERFTSKMASHAISQSGMTKKKRQNKALIDEVSAVIILQTYMNRK
jgi:putative Holliday junction resolvase